MKRHVVLISLILFCFSGIARDLGESWVITNKGKMDCSKVRLGYNKARVVLENGQKAAITFSTISSYSQNGKVFVKLPLYRNGKPTNQSAFMELVKTSGNLSLYRLMYRDMALPVPDNTYFRYFLYDGKKLHLALDDRTLPNICVFLGLNYAEL